MAEKANDYRSRAEEADKKADDAKTPETLQVWREVARRWRAMAEQRDRLLPFLKRSTDV
jgi:hypothetical protein